MNKGELDFILQEGEGLKIEFKESLSNIDKEIAAFANSEGGRIFLGVSDDNKIKGIEVNNKLKSQIQDIANNCDPPARISFEEFDKVLIIHVKKGKDKPYRCSSGFYLRQGPNSQKMKTKDIKDMIFAEGNVKFDESINEDFDFKDFDNKIFDDYLRRAGIKKTIGRNGILFNLGVINKDRKISNSGVLFFSKSPKKYFINAYVTCARYDGTDKVDVLDRMDIESNLIAQVEESIKFIRRNTRTSYKIKDIEREEIPEYPLEALREAIINAVMHRDYFERGANVQIDIFDDGIQISNVGSLIPPLNRENLGQIAVRRNPMIAELFHRIKFVEKIGSGLRRIKDECKKHGKISFEIETNGYFISIFKLKVGERVGERVGEKLTENQIMMLEEISKDQFISAPELSNKVGISKRKIEENIAKLKQKGLLKRIGPAKGGYWKILKNE